ncbi:hypothetical protein MGN70_008855 [Eutypa lata]|uniref:Cell wall protein n=1 Tax=Eutypa lata (strain UCR-EL1) TaxID=1287681 RepID=M7T773_EUTLA|nr:hypothetical protein UCREL1_206 [Eutypa lata UCREL1]KAI1249244.1 hypothetical protein MGN70_008855 [Eutypa lata]
MYAYRMLITTLMVAGAAVTSARSIAPRQFLQDGLACNIARLKIVGALGDTEDSIGQIQDTAVQNAATTGLQKAQGGVKTIAKAIVAGDAPPAAARDQVEAGLTAMGNALSGADTSDQAVVDAQESLDDATQAGQDVVSEC